MKRLLAGVFGVGVATLAYASLVERRWYALRRHRVPCLPPGSPNLTLLHISDLHLRAHQGKKIGFLKSLAELKPDIVIGTGDFLGDPDSVPATLDAVGDLTGRVASIFVLGSNDYYSPTPKNPARYLMGPSKHNPKGRQNPWREMTAGLQERGWLVLTNERIEVGAIDIVGLDDPHIGRAKIQTATARTMPGLRLAVAHSPEPAFELAHLGYDVILSGHTHGGQLRVPGYGAVVTNTHGLPREMVRGLHPINGGWLHVSAGLGTSMYAPVRFACRPEACVLDLVPREGD